MTTEEKKDPTEINKVDTKQYLELQDERDRIKEAHQSLQGKVAELESITKKFDGVDLDRLMANNEAYQRMLDKEAEGSGDESKLQERIDAAIASARQEHDAALGKERERAEKFESLYTEMAITREVMTKLNPHILDAEDVHEFFEAKVKESFALDEDGKVYVKNKDGEKRFKDGGSTPFSAEDWVTEVVAKFPSFAKSKTKSGTMRPGETASRNGTTHRTKTPPPGLSRQGLTDWYRNNPDAKPPTLN